MASNKITSCDYNIRTTGNTNVTVTTSNFVVNGNLVINGDATYIDTEVNILNVVDPNIVLNSSLTSAPYAGNSGIIVNRGNESNVAVFWNESVDAWQIATEVGNDSSYSNIATAADLTELDDIPLPNVGGVTQLAQLGVGALTTGGGFPTTTEGFCNIAFANEASPGGTRIYFNNGTENDELISKRKAIVYGIIF